MSNLKKWAEQYDSMIKAVQYKNSFMKRLSETLCNYLIELGFETDEHQILFEKDGIEIYDFLISYNKIYIDRNGLLLKSFVIDIEDMENEELLITMIINYIIELIKNKNYESTNK